MNFEPSEEQVLIRQTARQIGERHLAPVAQALDNGQGHDDLLANLQRLAEAGFMGLNLPAELGGTQAGTVAYALSIEELGRVCASTTVTVSITNMVGEVICACGSDAQKSRHIPKLCDGTYPAASFCLTEAGAGSDPSAMTTSARRDGNEWVLNGTKQYISSAQFAGLFVVWAVTDPAAKKGKNISCFLVEPSTPGVVIGKPEAKMGQHGSITNPVSFDDCRLPADALMGRENDGFRTAVAELAGGRIGVAALALGISRAAMDAARAYVLERSQFGKKIADFQGIQWMIADRETELEAARLLILQAASLKDAGRPFATAASMAKLFATEAAQRATYAALQLHGGAGYLKDLPLERYARDARITTIYEGTSEIQRLIIARALLHETV
ncbi:MAG: acyl-CoA dehydrogenase family protein [Hyphomicrobiales bacterium]